MTEAHVCEQLAQNRYMKVDQPGLTPATLPSRVTESDDQTITPPRYVSICRD